MKIEWVKLKNYRSYAEEAHLRISPITVLVGPNGIGKSSVLEALDLFFNKNGFSKEEDGTIENTEDVEITVAFSEVPGSFSLDEGAITNFKDEPYLLNMSHQLVIRKVYKRQGLTTSNPSVALHCTVPHADMLEIIGESNTALKKRITALKREASCDQTINASMRKALYEYYLASHHTPIEEWVDIQKRQAGIESILPYFAIFKSDRLNSSKDAEVSEPVKYAIQSAVKQLTTEIEPVIARVADQIQDILNRANDTLADSFGGTMPKFSANVGDDLAKAFTAELKDAKGILLEKQGSGVRRLYMFNLLISEASRKAAESSRSTIIYGIEEPETSQHPDFQQKLIEALRLLSVDNQVILTTHNPNLLSQFERDSIRVVRETSPKIGDCNEAGVLASVVKQLGILPDPLPNAKFRALLVVEGPTDVAIFEKIKQVNPAIRTALQDVWIVSGGGHTIRDWARSEHFCALGVPQFFLVDSDYTRGGGYGQTRGDLERALREAARPDLQFLLPLRRREIEQYLHPSALKRCLESRGISTAGIDALIVQLEDIYHPAADVLKSIGELRTSPVPFTTPHQRGMTIQDQLATTALRGYSLMKDGHKRMVSEIIFGEMTDVEVAERFQYTDTNGTAKCELSEWASKISDEMERVG